MTTTLPFPSKENISSKENIRGTIERITFHNEDNGFSILRANVRGFKDVVTLTGFVSSVSPGESFEAQGGWFNHREYGLQFKADFVRTIQPQSLEGIEKYLGSGMIKGIGPHFAKKLVQAFGCDVFQVIEQTPDKLKTVKGIGEVRFKKILAAWQEQKTVREIMVFLQSHGVSTSRAVRIYKTYGQNAIERVRANPYQLARDIHGIGFKSADTIASHLGIAKDSPMRARAGVLHVLLEKVGDGNCAYPRNELLAEATELLEMHNTVLEEAIECEIREGEIYSDEIENKNVLYPAGTYHSETSVALRLLQLAKGPSPWGKIECDKAIAWVEKKQAMVFDKTQKKAITLVLESKVSIITGGPGTGKTTITRAILDILRAKKVTFALCSPTGRAAKRLSEVSGVEAKTIHRLLGFDPKKRGFKFDRDHPLPIDFLLVDETSMVDIILLHHLLKALSLNTAIAFVGDVDQLPSVGPGTVLESLIECGSLAAVRLAQIYRQGPRSEIVVNAHRINKGEMITWTNPQAQSDFYFVAADEPEDALRKLTHIVTERIPKKFGFHPLQDIQVLCPMNRSSLGTRSINFELQKILNPNPSSKIEKYGMTYAPGDKVMVMANDYDKEIFNGDLGFVTEIDHEEQQIEIKIDGRNILLDWSEMDILTLAYAISVHKAQGAEFAAVVMPVMTQHFLLLQRNLLYTGVTRGKKLVVIIGQKKAVAMAIKSVGKNKRWSKLTDRLRNVTQS